MPSAIPLPSGPLPFDDSSLMALSTRFEHLVVREPTPIATIWLGTRTRTTVATTKFYAIIVLQEDGDFTSVNVSPRAAAILNGFREEHKDKWNNWNKETRNFKLVEMLLRTVGPLRSIKIMPSDYWRFYLRVFFVAMKKLAITCPKVILFEATTQNRLEGSAQDAGVLAGFPEVQGNLNVTPSLHIAHESPSPYLENFRCLNFWQKLPNVGYSVEVQLLYTFLLAILSSIYEEWNKGSLVVFPVTFRFEYWTRRFPSRVGLEYGNVFPCNIKDTVLMTFFDLETFNFLPKEIVSTGENGKLTFHIEKNFRLGVAYVTISITA